MELNLTAKESGMPPSSNQSTPLCVDMDGTLVHSDLLLESLVILLKARPMTLFLLPVWLLRGKAYFKHAIASRVDISNSQFPLNNYIVEYVRAEKQNRETILVTGSHESLAVEVAKKVGIFDSVKGSDETTNLTANNKRDWLVGKYGEKGFDYIGNDKDDLDVWPSARHAMVVSPEGGISTTEQVSFFKVFKTPTNSLRDYLRLMRVHQWSKNTLVFVPYLLEQRFNDQLATTNVLIAFLAISLLASATYIINDLLDLQADRENSAKSRRALASGQIDMKSALRLVVLLFILSMLLASIAPPALGFILGGYLVTTLSYSLFLKRRVILDVCTLATLHTGRVILGSLIINAELSFWLLAFSMFLFFSLALAKRVAELMNLKEESRVAAAGRGYRVTDIPILQASGVSTGYISVLVVALYINSEKVQMLYLHPEVLWGLCPIFMFWIGRIWIKAARGEMLEDPILYALHDKTSLVAAAALICIVLVSKFF